MAITNLTGYTWVGNETLDLSFVSEEIRYNVNFKWNDDSGVKDGSEIYFTAIAIGNLKTFNLDVSGALYSNKAGWQYKYPLGATLTFTGGTDATNSELISWLSANGTLKEPILQLAPFLTSIANAIRTKKGTTAQINAQDFASEIESIESGGGVKFENIGDPNIVFSIKNNAKTNYPIKLMSVNYDTSVSAFSISKVAASTTTFNFQLVDCPYLDTGIKIAGLINNVFVFGHGTAGTDKKMVGTFHILYINRTSGGLSEETYNVNYSATFEHSIQFKFPYKSDKAIICIYFESTE